MSAVTLSLVVAVAENGVIGADGRLPWRLSSDLKTFRRLTMGKPIIMGRKTYQSIGKPLDGRDNIVLSRDPEFAAPAGVTVIDSWDGALTLARVLAATKGAEEIMVIGGAGVFAAALPLADRIYWTEVRAAPEGETRFPEFDRAAWHEVSRQPIPRGPRDEHDMTLTVLERTADDAAPGPA